MGKSNTLMRDTDDFEYAGTFGEAASFASGSDHGARADDVALCRLLARFAPELVAAGEGESSDLCRSLLAALGSYADLERAFVLETSDAAPAVVAEWHRAGLAPMASLASVADVLGAVAGAAATEEVRLLPRGALFSTAGRRALDTDALLLVPCARNASERLVLALSPGDRLDASDPVLRSLADTLASALRRERQWKAMRSDQNRFLSIAASGYLGVLVIDSEGRVYEANDAALRSLGRTRRELEDGKIYTNDQTLPEYIERDGEAMRRLKEHGFSRPWRKEMRSRDGQVIPLLVSTVPIRGETDRYLCTVLEISPVKRRETALQVRRAEMEFAANLSRRFIRATPAEIDAELHGVLEEIASFFGADVVAVYEHAGESNAARVLHSYLSDAALAARDGRLLRGFETTTFPTLMASLQRDLPFVAPDVFGLPADMPEMQWLRLRKLRATVVVPVALGGELSAFAMFASTEPRPAWDMEALPTFRVLSEMLATALDRSRAETERLRAEKATHLVASLSTGLINLAPDAIEPAIDDVLAKLGEFLEADGCAIFESTLDHKRAYLSHVWSPEFVGRRDEYRVVALEPMSWAYTQLRRGQTVVVADSSQLGPEAGALGAVLSPFGVRSLMLVPMMFEGRLAGFGGYVWMHRNREDLVALDPVLRLLGELIVNARERKRQDEELRRLHAGLEERVADRTAQLNAMNRELSSFSYSVSHDLRSPLRSINGFTQMLRDDHGHELSVPARELLDGICRTTRRMAELIDALLNLTRISRAAFQCNEVDLSAIAREIAERLSTSDPGRRVEFVVAPDLVAIGEERMVRIVMENLLGNSWKFTSKNPEARIEVGSEFVAGRQAFFVRDDGAGFEMSQSNKLFGTFQRLHHTSDFEGHGVGLATVQRIVRLHGGEVWAEAEVGCGATFWFTFAPVARDKPVVA